jgi:hypothetical protein
MGFKKNMCQGNRLSLFILDHHGPSNATKLMPWWSTFFVIISGDYPLCAIRTISFKEPRAKARENFKPGGRGTIQLTNRFNYEKGGPPSFSMVVHPKSILTIFSVIILITYRHTYFSIMRRYGPPKTLLWSNFNPKQGDYHAVLTN